MSNSCSRFAIVISALLASGASQAQIASNVGRVEEGASTAAEAGNADGGDDLVVTAQRNNRTEVSREGNLGALGRKSASDVPFSIKSYNEQLILNQQPTSLGQVLENDPSVRTTYGFGNAAEQFVIRGFSLAGDDVSLNGLYGITPRQLVAPELYGSVQVLNGASAFLNGAAPGGSGFGGNVNLLTKIAGDSPLTRATANYTSSSHFGGSFDVSRRLGAGGEWGMRVNGAYRSGDVSIDDENRRVYVIGAAFDYRTDRARLFLDLAYQRYEVDRLRPTVSLATTTVPRVPDADANYGQVFSETNLRDIYGTLRGEYDLADNAMLYASAGAIDTAEDGVYGGITVTDAATGAGTGSASIIPFERDGQSVTAGLRVKLAAGGVTNEFNVGGSHIWQVNRTAYDFRYANANFAPAFLTNLYDTVQVPLPTGFSFAGGNLDDPFPISRSRIGSAFASDTLGLFDDRVLVTGGLRLQNIQSTNYLYSDGSVDTRYDESAVTPVVGLVLKPSERVSLFANRIEGLAAGSTAPTLAQNPNVTNPGEVFAPFKTRQYEAGGKLFLGRFNLSLAAFQIDLPSAYVVATPTATNPAAVTFGYNGQQRNRGVELSLDGEPVRGLRVIAGGTFTDAKLRRTNNAFEGNDVPGVPEWLANANVEWDLPVGVTLTGRVVYTGTQWVDTANTLKLDDWTRFDLGARYVVPLSSVPLTLRLTVDNVANRRYWASAFGSFGAQLLQGLPRTFKASASIDF